MIDDSGEVVGLPDPMAMVDVAEAQTVNVVPPIVHEFLLRNLITRIEAIAPALDSELNDIIKKAKEVLG